MEEAVNMLTFVPASHWGLQGRGLIREGYLADINVFDAAIRRAADAGREI